MNPIEYDFDDDFDVDEESFTWDEECCPNCVCKVNPEWDDEDFDDGL